MILLLYNCPKNKQSNIKNNWYSPLVLHMKETIIKNKESSFKQHFMIWEQKNHNQVSEFIKASQEFNRHREREFIFLFKTEKMTLNKAVCFPLHFLTQLFIPINDIDSLWSWIEKDVLKTIKINSENKHSEEACLVTGEIFWFCQLVFPLWRQGYNSSIPQCTSITFSTNPITTLVLPGEGQSGRCMHACCSKA